MDDTTNRTEYSLRANTNQTHLPNFLLSPSPSSPLSLSSFPFDHCMLTRLGNSSSSYIDLSSNSYFPIQNLGGFNFANQFREIFHLMAAYANYLRLARLGTSSGVNLSTLRSIGGSPNPTFDRTLFDHHEIRSSSSSPLVSYSPYRQFHARFISQLIKTTGKRLFLVDTLALVRSLEAQGLPSKQAEAITAAITEVLNDSLGVVSQLVVSKGEMQKAEMTQESNLSKFKSEINSSLDHHFSLLQHENEKLRNDIERIRSDIRHEIDKVTAGQRLDLNLEKGRIRDELQNQNAETCNLTNKLDREIHTLRAQLEAAKYEVIKYCIGTLVSISAVGLAVLRIVM
ncbi:PREDICTED: coiled-coil domain-containing protein 90B, mitochondrial-like [Camelina sativa]|uniref:Coiled-coil domain-containing protein 90B, mitochondrial-like n=1 Tax=Camelina sativa TaxID=90675 RepID=A0ABM0THW4_CAMSA|nr:PREDICTED: coiled-coil domain-containing protein 90B, mitochondrial-like [Camelina sativa]